MGGWFIGLLDHLEFSDCNAAASLVPWVMIDDAFTGSPSQRRSLVVW